MTTLLVLSVIQKVTKQKIRAFKDITVLIVNFEFGMYVAHSITYNFEYHPYDSSIMLDTFANLFNMFEVICVSILINA